MIKVMNVGKGLWPKVVAVEGKQLRAAWFGLMTGAWVNWHYEKANEKNLDARRGGHKLLFTDVRSDLIRT